VRDWLDEPGINAYVLAKAVGARGNRLLAILAGRSTPRADPALQMCADTGTCAEVWVGLLSACDF
jgi:plasmid maintenance system antidote protein VapI